MSDLCLVRKMYAYGDQGDYFGQPNCIGWTRSGTWGRPFGLACVMSNTGPNELWMEVGHEHIGERWTDVLGWSQGKVLINQDGWGCFWCPGGVSVAVWVNEQAIGRERLGKLYVSSSRSPGN